MSMLNKTTLTKPTLFLDHMLQSTLSVLALSLTAASVVSQTLTFTAANTPAIGAQLVVSADFNRDGKMDLAACAGQSVLVLTNNGAGVFGSNSAVALAQPAVALAAADMTADGKADLITASALNSNVTVFANSGASGFIARNVLSLPFQPSYMTVADINNDGKPDIIVVGTTNPYALGGLLRTYTNNGASFGLFSSMGVGDNPVWVAAADINNDGKVDVAISDFTDNAIRVFTNNGAGFGGYSTNHVTTGMGSVTVADLNNDGKPDLACLSSPTPTSGTLTVLTNSGTGFAVEATLGAGHSPTCFIVANLHNNDKLDLVCVTADNTFTVFGNTGSGFNTNTTLATGFGPSFVTAADFNNDGKLDLAFAEVFNYVEVFAQTTASPYTLVGFSSSTISAGPYSFSVPEFVISADFNNDGKQDLASANPEDAVYVLTNTGNADFPTMSPTPAVGYDLVVAADINRDGKLDLIAADPIGKILVMTNNGIGGFGSNNTLTVAKPVTALAIADMNADGKADLITASTLDSNVVVFANNGSGGFAALNLIILPFQPSYMTVADVNNDGKPDIIVVGTTDPYALGGKMNAYTNNGTGFGLFSSMGIGDYPVWVAAADINNDGKVDVAITDFTDNAVRVFTNNGAGFAGYSTNQVTTGMGSVTVADVNHDGKPDLVCLSSPTPSVGILTVLTNSGSRFTLMTTSATGKSPTSVIAADLRNDGNLELVCANFGETTLSIFTPIWMDINAVPPRLQISLGGSNLVLSWSSAYSAYLVQTNSSFGSGWAAMGGTIVPSNGTNFSFTTPLPKKSPLFFRLSQGSGLK